MFNCKNCGLTKSGETQNRIVSIIRSVDYIIQICYERRIQLENVVSTEVNYKTIKNTKGTEIVREEIYCNSCVPKNTEPKLIGSVTRKMVVAKKKLKKDDKEVEENKKRSNKDGRIRKNNKSV